MAPADSPDGGTETADSTRSETATGQHPVRRAMHWLGNPRHVLLAALASAVVLLFIPMIFGEYMVRMAASVLVFGLLAASLDLIWGYTGLLSFGHAVFFGIGGYITAYLFQNGTTSIPIAIVIAFGIGVAIGAIIVYPALATNTTGVYIAVITLIYSLLIEIAALEFDDISGGYTGLSVFEWPTLGLTGDGIPLDSYSLYYYAVLVTVFAFLCILYWVANSGYGRVLRAIRENTERVRAIGYNPRRYQLSAFCLSGGVAAVAGALYTPLNAGISPQIFQFHLSGRAILYVLLGGKATIFGSILGTGLIYIPEDFIASAFPGLWMYVVGALFILLVLFLPDGIITRVAEEFRLR